MKIWIYQLSLKGNLVTVKSFDSCRSSSVHRQPFVRANQDIVGGLWFISHGSSGAIYAIGGCIRVS